jgi:hypothetical protein
MIVAPIPLNHSKNALTIHQTRTGFLLCDPLLSIKIREKLVSDKLKADLNKSSESKDKLKF